MIVYRATCPNGLSYIGITRGTLEFRRRQHERACVSPGRDTKFYVALRLWRSRMKWGVIASARTWSELRELERKYVAEFNSYEKGYNSSPGGENNQVVLSESIDRETGVVTTIYSSSDAGRNVGKDVAIDRDHVKTSGNGTEFSIDQSDFKLQRSRDNRAFREALRSKKKEFKTKAEWKEFKRQMNEQWETG